MTHTTTQKWKITWIFVTTGPSFLSLHTHTTLTESAETLHHNVNVDKKIKVDSSLFSVALLVELGCRKNVLICN